MNLAEYIAVLHKATEHCKYGDSLSEMIRDRLVCDITNTTVQKRLLAEKELNLDKAVSLAQSIEVAEQGAKDLQMATTAKSTTNADAGSMLDHQTNMMVKKHTSLNPVIVVAVNIHLTFVDSNLNVVTVVVKLGT